MDSAVRFDELSKSWKLDPLTRKRVDAAARGAFVFREDMKLSDITDGLANTILVGELATNQGDRDCRTSPALGLGSQTADIPVRGGLFDAPRGADQFVDPERPRFWIGPEDRSAPKLPTRADEFRGMRWADARAVFTGFNTILSPNSYLQVAGQNISGPAVAPASSHHLGGVHILFADGSIQFIIDSIDSGDAWGGTIRLGMPGRLAPGSPSPFGPWGALGTRAANDND
jgi:prepilin-type processing-associated H-X9-DG protein